MLYLIFFYRYELTEIFFLTCFLLPLSKARRTKFTENEIAGDLNLNSTAVKEASLLPFLAPAEMREVLVDDTFSYFAWASAHAWLEKFDRKAETSSAAAVDNAGLLEKTHAIALATNLSRTLELLEEVYEPKHCGSSLTTFRRSSEEPMPKTCFCYLPT